MVWHNILLLNSLLWLAAASQSTSSLAKPNCADMCGTVYIPYPFGMGSDCYMNEWFSITCSNSTYPPTPFLSLYNTEVLGIDLVGSTLLINSNTPNSCGSYTTESINLGDNPYLIYSANNRFSTLGCDVVASISNDNEILAGCMSICNQITNSSNQVIYSGSDTAPGGSGCFGVDCCQTMIPYGLKNFTVTVNGTKPDNVESTCKYAFLADESWDPSQFSYPFDNVPREFPVVLDWKFTEKDTCQICGPNTNCSMVQNVVSCSCPTGFSGNPYLPQGCTASDLCANPILNLCIWNGTSAYGNSTYSYGNSTYSCLCPSCYHGDGLRGGTGCVKNKVWVLPFLIGTGTAIGLLFLPLGIWRLIKLIQRRKSIKLKEKFFKRNGGLLLQQKVSSDEGTVETTKLFTSTELEVATDKYNENRILGQGGQGTVYKGMLTDGRIVAVKKSKIVNEGQLEQFINEVVILSQIDHRNIVKLLGCCLETEVPLLVYEFIPNGTLSHLIHDQKEEFPMSWEMRLRIATEVASAISYLHSAASVPIFHRDIKSTNILLAEKFRAKVSDFGTSKSVTIDQTHLTTQVKGTFGYLDPEYFQSSQFTEKSDVYSFGVVLVELLTGDKPISSIGSQEMRGLATYFISSMEEERLLDILDPRVAKEGGKEELMAVAILARRCLSLNGKKRPTMKEVVIELERIRRSQGYLPPQHEQVELCEAEPTEHWEFSSTSTGSHLDSDFRPLMVSKI